MNIVLSSVGLIQANPIQVVKIQTALKGFADACNYANNTVKSSITSKNTPSAGDIHLRGWVCGGAGARGVMIALVLKTFSLQVRPHPARLVVSLLGGMVS
ncbi:MAG: hypothetical protein F6J98_30695 [Moorea sp. SIO4G2]|uniref:Uncharacterized protein n=1 Tax=Moorena bouillonii PNG TaxID=568701 RepID=A0A1U7N1M1_9CYAN|nr:hypothetical protein [Moorena bouillonii]NEO64543.1 hypothetical protein [Moorena sp. SIO4G2]OLT59850.1 hypothetical protein BJP37_13285 [Moorena bouillonii PNG]